MSDQDSNLISAPPEVDASDGPSDEWLAAHRTTAEEQQSTRWLEGRNQDVLTDRAIRQALGHDYDGYHAQLAALSSDERLNLIDKSPEEIAAHLDERAEAERVRKKREETVQKQAKEQAEAQFRETSELRKVRHAMKSAYQDADSLDGRIAELQRLNEMRNDLSAEGWDKLPAEKWRAAREGKLESNASEIANLIQEKQAKLQEAALHQSAYHEGSRAIEAPPHGYSVPDVPIGHIVGNDGQPMQITRADIATIVQLERDDQSHQHRTIEARKHYPDWERVATEAAASGVDVGDREAAFIKSLPNSADVVYYLCSHPHETMALARMPGHEATRTLIDISHRAARSSASEAPRTTSAPKPPSFVGGRSSRAFDANDESISNEEWFRQRNSAVERRGRH